MAAIVDEYLDTPMESDDGFPPCRGCGELLEEGKAFELAGNRWHLDCFRCNTCNTLLDSDANLLLLGDGSLICNNCTYSCSACGNKIEDLAILTGTQAFCSTCFRCRNCKRKIDNLRYARTSQGIFCMGCHDTIMARKKKRNKAAAAAKAAREKENSPMIKDKSLPALPPSAIPNGAFSNDRVEPESDTPTELSPRPHNSYRTESGSRSRSGRSPERQSDSSKPEGLGLSSNTYRQNRNSSIISKDDVASAENGDGFFISVGLDPSPAPTPQSGAPDSADGSKQRDYFGSVPAKSTEKRTESHAGTPHIAFQEKGRQHSSDIDIAQLKSSHNKSSKTSSRQDMSRPSPAADERPTKSASARLPQTQDEAKPADAPHSRKISTSVSDSVAMSGSDQSGKDGSSSLSPSNSTKASDLPLRASQDSRKVDEAGRSSIESSSKPSGPPKPIARKEVGSTNRNVNGKPVPPTRSSTDEAVPPHRQGPSRPSIPEPMHGSASDSYLQPRSAPPRPPPIQSHAPGKESISSSGDIPSPKSSPKLPRWSNGGDFSLDEDMARILGTDEQASSLLRRVSTAVRHGRTASIDSGHAPPARGAHARSVSETTRATASPRWSRTNLVDPDLTSPASLSPADDAVILKKQLRTSEQRVAELERQFNSESDLKNLNKKLIEKRKTVSVLDTQNEIMIRQLEVLAGHVERGKEAKSPINFDEMKDSAIKDFFQKLQKVKIAMSAEIEQLHEERDQIIEEKIKAMTDRDRALMEFEQLSSKNAQLANMNNEMTQQLQGRYKHGHDGRAQNGLGIYSQNKGSTTNLDTASMSTGPTLVTDDDAVVEAGPTVVQVRKGQVKKFNWKKGGKNLGHHMAKGVNRAVVAFQQNERPPASMGGDIGVPYNATVVQADLAGPPTPSAPVKHQPGPQPMPNPAARGQPNDRQGFGFFGKKAATMPKSGSAANMNMIDVAEPPNVLFGSELAERAEFERRHIPSIVTRCIEEVELRGMDQEGIYRKTGGNSQVNMIKEGLDKSENYDISDPDLDITAVTSVLKQYFRKLPTPLITFEVYERILESNDETERCAHLRKALGTMPESHRDCLEFLMFHLTRVAKREPENLMSPKNLAVVFAPTIMRDRSIEREMSDMHAKNLAIQFVVENSHTIFDDA